MGGVQGASERVGDGRHPLRHPLVEARHDVGEASPSTRCSSTSGSIRAAFLMRGATAATRRTCRSRTSRRRRPRSRSRTTGKPLASGAWRPGATWSCPSLLLEEREVDQGSHLATTTSRASGSRTATTSAAIHGRSSGTREIEDWQVGPPPGGWRLPPSTARPDDRSSRARLAGSPPGPASRPPSDGRGRLRVERTYSIASEPERTGRDHRRTDRGRRGLAVPPRRVRDQRPNRAPRPDRRLLRLGSR